MANAATRPMPSAESGEDDTIDLDPETFDQDEVDKAEADRVERKTTPRTPAIYETVRRAVEDEIGRPLQSLWWSGLAAGLSISFSFFVQTLLYSHLPETPWRHAHRRRQRAVCVDLVRAGHARDRAERTRRA